MSLTDTVEHRLAGIQLHGDRITLRQLLNHTAGVAIDDMPQARNGRQALLMGSAVCRPDHAFRRGAGSWAKRNGLAWERVREKSSFAGNSTMQRP